jgi:hypothetical protein
MITVYSLFGRVDSFKTLDEAEAFIARARRRVMDYVDLKKLGFHTPMTDEQLHIEISIASSLYVEFEHNRKWY